LNNLGVALTAQGRFEEAIGNYYQAIQIDPNYARRCIIWVSPSRPGRFDEAIENYYKAVQIAPNRFEIYCNLGLHFAAQGRFE